jgi:peptidoglycan/LPS O-acetylase OafA/YrhL
VQGLRAVAVVLVVLFHSGLTAPGGYLGVDVFFVISGFVITRLLWRELGATGTIRLRTFSSRRVRRLLPALAIVLVFVAVGSLLFQSPVGLQQQTSTIGSAAAVFLANVALYLRVGGGYFALPNSVMPLLHTWTLAVEEQFYLFFPVTLLVAWKLGGRLRERGRRRLVVAVVAAVVVVSFGAAVALTYAHPESTSRLRSFAFFASPTRAWQFAVGSLLALGEARLARLDRRVALAAGALGLVAVLWGAWAFDAQTAFPGFPALVPTFGAALLIAAGTATGDGVGRLLATRPAVWVGDLSYGWYLWHWPVIVFTRIAWPGATSWGSFVAACASLVPTWLSYRFVEDPIRADRRIVGRRALVLAGACCLVPLVGFRVTNTLAKHPSSNAADLTRQHDAHFDVARGCASGDGPDAPAVTTKCTWTVPHPKGTVLLVGDSNAGQFAEPVVAAGNAAGYDVILATDPSCVFADLVVHHVAFDSATCAAFVRTWSDWVAAGHASLVITASNATRATRESGFRFVDPVSGASSSGVDGKAAIWGRGLARTLTTLARGGTPVVFVHNVPQFGAFDLRTCPGYLVARSPARCGVTRNRDAVRAEAAPARRAEDAALDDRADVHAVDFDDRLCTADRCATNRGRFFVFRDGGHLSVDGALELTPTFASLIGRYARPGETGG